MSGTLESITAATQLRRAVMEAQKELDAKRELYMVRMARVREVEEIIAADRARLQDKLVRYYKFIQENEIKRTRASRKAVTEERIKKEREEQIAELTRRLNTLNNRREGMRKQYDLYAKYQQYLEEVLQRNDCDEYQSPRDIIHRWNTLQENTKVLQRRKTQLEEELLRNKNSLNMKRQRKNNESVELQNQLNELQATYETLQKSIKIKQDELERCINQRVATSRTVSHVRMACKNLYDRCIAWAAPYSGRGKFEARESDVLYQLHVIGDCLQDFQDVIAAHQQRQQQQQVAESRAAKDEE
ncbi:flagellar associated protein [Trypanosoma rangeli]|uniref:Flagellar associated protein n=1 Tax=Trypanosoma rangeli TaxID=5698 RepID=A0A422NNY8_TRYRA|nr:flagellar associated protein [Trypanosoma rangeli]RNF07220.1 flagellar associated protein [Trypanosoma rangeli]|eukprot:RNF07220.1 flagellar associated protein [Trypanosoma rangeli]